MRCAGCKKRHAQRFTFQDLPFTLFSEYAVNNERHMGAFMRVLRNGDGRGVYDFSELEPRNFAAVQDVAVEISLGLRWDNSVHLWKALWDELSLKAIGPVVIVTLDLLS